MKSTKFLAAALLAVVASASAAVAETVPPAVDVPAIVGKKSRDWTPPALAKLTRGMTPEAAGAVLPGAEQVSKYGFAEIARPGIPGVAALQLYFLDGKASAPRTLMSVKLTFDASLVGDAGFAALLEACSARYGKPGKGEVEKRLVTWAGPRSAMAQLSRASGGEAWTLDITLPRR